MGKGIVVYFAPFKIPYSLLCFYSTSHIHSFDMGTYEVTSSFFTNIHAGCTDKQS